MTNKYINIFYLYNDSDNETNNEGRLRTNKREFINVPIVNFPFICSNIPAALAYGVCISQLIGFPELVIHILISLIEGCC